MRMIGAKKLQRQLRKARRDMEPALAGVVRKNTEKAAQIARSLVPVDSGELKGWIFTQYDEGGLVGSVEAGDDTKEQQVKSRAVEFGREKGNRGTTSPQPYIRPAQGYIQKKHAAAVGRVVNKVIKEATRG